MELRTVRMQLRDKHFSEKVDLLNLNLPSSEYKARKHALLLKQKEEIEELDNLVLEAKKYIKEQKDNVFVLKECLALHNFKATPLDKFDLFNEALGYTEEEIIKIREREVERKELTKAEELTTPYSPLPKEYYIEKYGVEDWAEVLEALVKEIEEERVTDGESLEEFFNNSLVPNDNHLRFSLLAATIRLGDTTGHHFDEITKEKEDELKYLSTKAHFEFLIELGKENRQKIKN